MTEYLIRLKMKCGLGTDHFNAETYLSEREAFGSQIMNWRSAKTIDIYDQSRNGEAVFSTLAEYQEDLSQRRYAIQPAQEMHLPLEQGVPPAMPHPALPPKDQETNITWTLDAETLDWIKHLEQQGK